MTQPQQPPSIDTALQSLRQRIAEPGPGHPAAPTRPPAVAVAAPAPGVWGPSTPRPISPLGMLVKVADETYRLQKKVEQLATAITGEQAPQHRLREMPRAADGLLPAVAFLLHEIEAVHGEIAGLVEHIRGQL